MGWGQVKVKMKVAYSCLTLCSPRDCSPPGSSVHGISRHTGDSLDTTPEYWSVQPFPGVRLINLARDPWLLLVSKPQGALFTAQDAGPNSQMHRVDFDWYLGGK